MMPVAPRVSTGCALVPACSINCSAKEERVVGPDGVRKHVRCTERHEHYRLSLNTRGQCGRRAFVFVEANRKRSHGGVLDRFKLFQPVQILSGPALTVLWEIRLLPSWGV